MANLKSKKKVVVDNSISALEGLELLKKACQEKQRKFVENVETMSNNLKGVIEDKKANDQARANATNI